MTIHWKRGAELLQKDWEHSKNDLARFITILTEHANFPEHNGDYSEEDQHIISQPTLTTEVRFPVGEVSKDTESKETVAFTLNDVGGSPHMAIMGAAGSGKTRTLVHMLKELRTFGSIPLLAFDFKGDLAEGLASTYGADVISPPESPIPLDVLHLVSNDENAIKKAAARIRDSIASVKSSKIGGVQSGALRKAITEVLQNSVDSGKIATLSDIARALDEEYENQKRNPDELTATLNELTEFNLFQPVNAPSEFFSHSWIICLPQDGSEEMRKLIINLTLNALDGWLNAQPDAPTNEEGIRALRHVTLLDEAHVVLKTKLRALTNLVRMSRSKGGVVLLASQSPDDFEDAEEGYLDNMGLTLAFNTQAKSGPTRRIFGRNHSLTNLKPGEALCRIRTETKTRKITAWKK